MLVDLSWPLPAFYITAKKTKITIVGLRIDADEEALVLLETRLLVVKHVTIVSTVKADFTLYFEALKEATNVIIVPIVCEQIIYIHE